jgi:hypothetical protein
VNPGARDEVTGGPAPRPSAASRQNGCD